MDMVASHTELTATRTKTHTRVASVRHGAAFLQPLSSTRPGVLLTGHTEQRHVSAKTTTRKWATGRWPG